LRNSFNLDTLHMSDEMFHLLIIALNL
jgi:hypothetical protein